MNGGDAFMRNYQGFYGCDMSQFVRRERFSLSMSPGLLARVDSLSEVLNASRPDTIEVIIAFYFAYVAAAKVRTKRPPMSDSSKIEPFPTAQR
jgi:hypothetical protein